MTEDDNARVAEAFATLKAAITNDPVYARAWHYALVDWAFDVECLRETAHAGAARFMLTAFGVDTRAHLPSPAGRRLPRADD